MIKEIKHMAELKAYRQDWEAILERSRNNNPFMEFPWIEKWWEVMGHDYEMYVICVYADSGPIAFLPLMKQKGRFFQTITMITRPQSNYTDFIAEDDVKQAYSGQMLDYVMARNPNTFFLLSGFLESGGSAGMIREYAERNAKGFYTFQVMAPQFDYLTEDSPLLLKKRLKSHGVDRKGKRLKKEGSVSFRTIGEEHLEEMFRVHKKRWEMKWDVSGFTEEPVKTLFSEFASDEGKVLKPVVYGLFFEGTLIAFLYGMYCRDRFLFYLFGHDDDFGAYSPGKMILNHSIVSASQHNAGFFDFTIGEEQYKHEWKTGADFVHHFLLMNRPSPAASLIFSYYKLKQRMAVLLKRHYSFVLFKRNTLGRWRKYAANKKLLQQKSAGLLQAGLRRLFSVDARFIYKKEITMETDNPSPYTRVTLKTVMEKRENGQGIKEIVDRLYKGQRGYCREGDPGLSDIMWVSDKPVALGGKRGMLSLPLRSVSIEVPIPSIVLDGLEANISEDFPGTEQFFIISARKSKHLEESGFRLETAYRTVNILGFSFRGRKRRNPAITQTLVGEKSL